MLSGQLIEQRLRILQVRSVKAFREPVVNPGESDGFIRGIKWRGNVNASQTREVQFSQNISQVFLGINMKCASCHDSFINDWKLKDAYGLAAIFSEKPLELFRCDKPTGEMTEPKWIFPELGTIDASSSEDHTSALQSQAYLVCRLPLEKKILHHY